jgi:hypothetical protein
MARRMEGEYIKSRKFDEQILFGLVGCALGFKASRWRQNGLTHALRLKGSAN